MKDYLCRLVDDARGLVTVDGGFREELPATVAYTTDTPAPDLPQRWI